MLSPVYGQVLTVATNPGYRDVTPDLYLDSNTIILTLISDWHVSRSQKLVIYPADSRLAFDPSVSISVAYESDTWPWFDDITAVELADRVEIFIPNGQYVAGDRWKISGIRYDVLVYSGSRAESAVQPSQKVGILITSEDDKVCFINPEVVTVRVKPAQTRR